MVYASNKDNQGGDVYCLNEPYKCRLDLEKCMIIPWRWGKIVSKETGSISSAFVKLVFLKHKFMYLHCLETSYSTFLTRCAYLVIKLLLNQGLFYLHHKKAAIDFYGSLNSCDFLSFWFADKIWLPWLHENQFFSYGVVVNIQLANFAGCFRILPAFSKRKTGNERLKTLLSIPSV